MLQHVPGLNETLPSHSQASHASSASSSAGPITAYQSPQGLYHGLSAASQGHPSAPPQVSQGSTTQPFLGLNNLAVDLSRQVNQARLASSASSQPCQAQMAIWGRRRTTRGPAVAPPCLVSNARWPDVRHCVTEIFPQDGGPAQNALMMTIKVYPPSVCIPTSSLLVFLLNLFQVTPAAEYLLYRFHRDSVTQYLSDHHLVYHYTLSPSTLITDLIIRVTDDMSTSPSVYRFASSPENNMFLSHETQPLQLLGLVNKGTPRVSDNQVHLHTMPVTRSTTLQHWLTTKHLQMLQSASRMVALSYILVSALFVIKIGL